VLYTSPFVDHVQCDNDYHSLLRHDLCCRPSGGLAKITSSSPCAIGATSATHRAPSSSWISISRAQEQRQKCLDLQRVSALLGPLSRMINAYSQTQEKRPWVTQLVTSLFIYFCCDLSAQYINGDKYDHMRTLRHLTIGAISSIPAYAWCETVSSPIVRTLLIVC